MRWDGLFELISGRYGYPPPWPGPLQPADAPSRTSRHAISGDGRWIVFESDTTVFGYSSPGLYRRDRRSGQTELLFGNNARHTTISADGNHVAFELCDPWMRPDYAPICDVWTVDLRTWSPKPLSTALDGTFGSDASGEPVLSADGRFVVFVTKATNITLGPEGVRQVVLRDRDADGNGVFDEPGTAVLQTVSTNTSGEAGTADSDTAEVSDDGRFVAFRSLAPTLVAADTNGTWDVFLRDVQGGVTQRLNVGPEGQQSSSSIDSTQISMSADGRYVAFASADGLLAPSSIDDTNGVLDVFVWDAQSPWLTRIDIGWGPPVAAGYVPGNAATSWPTLSADGRYLSVQSAATNVEVPPATPGVTQVHVVDRLDQHATRVSVTRDGQDPSAPCARPAISRDGSVVLFWSQATNLVDVGSLAVDQLYAAVHFELNPAEVLVPGRGGTGTFTVTTQQHTLWWAEWDWTQYWFGTTQAPQGVGNGTMTFEAREGNPDPTQRSMVVRVGQASATFIQDVGVSLTSISPASGPMSGGTTVTLRGTGFEPGMSAYLGEMVATEFVDSTTITLVTPPYTRRGLVPVSVGTPDGRWAWIDNAFLYTDSTPPLVMGWAEGNQGENGWYVGDVTIRWGYWDPESEVTSSCPDVLVTADTVGTTYTCAATSEGGTGYGSITVKRDATIPTLAVTTPAPQQLLELHSVVSSDVACSDATSGVGNCGGGMPSGTPIDTAVPGWQSFSAAALDVAGNHATTSVEYAVSTGMCAPPAEGLRTWLRFDGNLEDVMSGAGTLNTGMPPDSYVEGKSGQAYRFVSRGSQSLEHWHDGRLNFGSAMSVAMWLKPGSATLGTLVKHKDQYRLERTAHGTINWMLLHPDRGPSFGTSYARAALNAWSHVVFTYAAGEVKVYVNGRLDRTWNVSGPELQPTYWNRIRIGGPDEWSGYPYVGAFDELQFFNTALSAADVENMFLAGAKSVCAPTATVLEVPSPISATYAAGTYHAIAFLRDANGTPLAGKPIKLEQRAFALAGEPLASTTKVTDANGMVEWDAPFDVVAGTYSPGFTAHFAGDLQHAHTGWVSATVIVGKATPQITWATPAPITYGTPLTYSGQLNATANVPGSFGYTPNAWSAPGAGTHTLRADFWPSDYRNYADASATVTLEVAKALPTVSITGGTFTYDGQPHPATASATEYRGLPLSPVTITYNGSAEPPVDTGVYTAVATFAGDANHLPHSASATVTITSRTPSIVFSGASSVTYDGQRHGLTASAYGVGGVLLGTLPVTYGGDPDAPVNAGVYGASATFEGNTNYASRTGNATLRINPATPVVTVSGGPFTYDRQPHEATIAVTGVGGEIVTVLATVTYNNAADLPVNAGTYTVTASIAASGNYTAASNTGALTVGKATPTVTVTDATFTYGTNGPFQAAAVVTGVGGEVLGPASVVYQGADGHPVNAGVYPVLATYLGSENYTPATGTGTLTVLKATPTLVVAVGTLTYDAQPHPAVVILAGRYGDSLGPYTVTYNGVADVPVNAGAYLVEATYEGSANYLAATASETLTILKAAVTLSVTGGTYTYDAQPHPAIVAATGVGGEAVTPVSVTYNGAEGAPLNAGDYAVVASYAGSVNYTAVTKTVEVRIIVATPIITVTGGTFTYNGQFQPATAAAVGVTGEVLSPVEIIYSRGVSWFDVPIAAGTYEVAATFHGSANYINKTARATLVIAPAPLSVRANDVAKRFGAPLPSFTATFAGFVNGETPWNLNGSLAFGTTATQASPVGTYPILPGGLSSPNYAISYVGGWLTVVKGAVAVSVSASPEPSGFEMPMTFTATVGAAAPAVGAPAGIVSFFDGTTFLGTATISGGVATLTTAGLDDGNRTIEARYDGDGSFEAGSGSSSHVVNAAAFTPAVAISSSRNPSNAGQTVTFTAGVSMSSVPVGGTVAFYDGPSLIGSSSIAAARATLSTAALAAGSHAITARFTGSEDAPPSVSPVFVQAVGGSGWKDRATTTSLVASSNPSQPGDGVVFTATVSGSSSAMPAGRVLFTIDGEVVGDAAGIAVMPLSGAQAQASVSVPGLAHGRHKVTATYLGDPTYKGSTAAVTQIVN